MGIRRISATTFASWLLIVTLSGALAAVENWGLTKFEVKKVEHNYTIEGYAHHDMEFGEKIESPLFWGDDSKEFKWQLVVYPRGFKDSEKNATAVFLRLVTKPPQVTGIKTNLQISIINNSNKKARTEKLQHRYTKAKESFGWSSFVGHRLIEVTNKDTWLPNDDLTFLIEIEFSTGMIRASTRCRIINTEPCTSLPYSSNFMPDVNLWAGEGINAHKAALIAHSTWFKEQLNMFPTERSISLPGEKAAIVKEAIKFIYTGKADTNEDTLEELLIFSNKYGMDKLKLFCEKALCEKMSGKNAGELLKLARKNKADNLQREAQYFILGLDEDLTK